MTFKKEFTSRWSKEKIQTQYIFFAPFLFEEKTADGLSGYAMLPIDLPYLELLNFLGKKTKITIEIVE
jgi:hypothetical protein